MSRSLRVFFVPPGISPLNYPRIATLCHVCIEVKSQTFRVVKNQFSGFQGAERPLDELHEYLNELEEVVHGTQSS